jgi:hypothetical protein
MNGNGGEEVTMNVEKRTLNLSQVVDPSQEAPETDKSPREKERDHESERRNPPPGRGIGQDLEDFRGRREAPGPFYRDWRGDIPI